MARQTIRDRGRGFLMLDAHPAGCQRTVDQMWAATPPAGPADGEGPVALVIGSSAGYGLAATVVGLARHRVSGVAVALERSADNRRNATAGWYRTARTGELARQAGSAMSFVNADAFADTTKEHVLDLIKRRFGKLGALVYSVAAPRRLDPRIGETFRSVVKPIGASYRTKHLSFDDDGAPKLSELEVAPAAIPGVALYLGLLRSVLGSRLMTPVEQCVQLWDHLLGSQSLPVDEQQRLRLDTWELAPGVQSEIRHRWQLVDQENLAGLTDAGWVLDEVRRLYGFSVPAIDYEQPVEIDVPWPAG